MIPRRPPGRSDAGELGGGGGLVGERAEGALADGGVEAVVVHREAFGVADLEADAVAEAGVLGAGGGAGDLGGAEVDAEYVDVVFGGEQQGAGADPGGDVEDLLTGLQPESVGEPSGERDAAGVVALAEEQRHRVDAVEAGAARLHRLGVDGAASHRRRPPTLTCTTGAVAPRGGVANGA